jgi:chromosome segregation ATPase
MSFRTSPYNFDGINLNYAGDRVIFTKTGENGEESKLICDRSKMSPAQRLDLAEVIDGFQDQEIDNLKTVLAERARQRQEKIDSLKEENATLYEQIVAKDNAAKAKHKRKMAQIEAPEVESKEEKKVTRSYRSSSSRSRTDDLENRVDQLEKDLADAVAEVGSLRGFMLYCWEQITKFFGSFLA